MLGSTQSRKQVECPRIGSIHNHSIAIDNKGSSLPRKDDYCYEYCKVGLPSYIDIDIEQIVLYDGGMQEQVIDVGGRVEACEKGADYYCGWVIKIIWFVGG